MDLLPAVNAILPKLGEHPVTSLSGRHSTVALILEEVDRQIKTVTQRGWWFNEYPTTLVPNTDGEIILPANTLSFVPDLCEWVNATQRAGKLYNIDDLNYTWTKSLRGTIKVRLAFNELPESAAEAVWYSALVAAYVTDIGLASDVQKWDQSRIEALSAMEAEHLDQKRYSTAKSPRYGKIVRAIRGA